MKNRLFLIIATAACLGSITSCSQDDGTVVPDGDLKAAISFNVNIGQTTAPQADMRGASNDATATGGYTFSTGDKICIAITGDGSTSRSTTEEKKLYKVETESPADAGATTGTPQELVYASTPATDAFIWMSTGEIFSLRAWSNGNSTTTTDAPETDPFTIPTDQKTANTQELLYSPAIRYKYGSNDGKITVPLFHQMSRIVVNVKGTLATATDESPIEIKDIYLGSSTDITASGTIKNQGKFTRPSNDDYAKAWTYENYGQGKSYDGTTPIADADKYGSWSGQSGAVNIKCKTETATTGYTATASAVIIPAEYTESTKFIVINTSNGTYAYSLGSNTTFDPGRQYTFNITDLNQIDLNVKVSAWVDDDNTALQF